MHQAVLNHLCGVILDSPYTQIQPVKTLEPRYLIPSRQHFSQVVMPKLYQEVRAHVVEVCRRADTVSITTDGWTSRAMQSYITITAHVINAEWELAGFVLQTRPLLESHTGANIAEVLKEAVAEWQLERQQQGIAVVTDNARNMDGEGSRAGTAHQVFRPHFKFSHPGWFECTARHALAGSDPADCELLPQEPDCHCCVGCEAKNTAQPGHQ